MPTSELKKFCAPLYHVSNILLRDTKYRARKRLCSNTTKRNELKVYISLKGNKLACLAKVYFRYKIWFMISEKRTSHGGSKILGSIGTKWGNGFKWIGYCENTLASFREWLVISVSLPQEILELWKWHIFSLFIA